MKKCTWCGKEYPVDAEVCAIDGQPLTDGELRTTPPTQQADPAPAPCPSIRQLRHEAVTANWQPALIDLEQLKGALVFREGYSRPNWQVIREAIKNRVEPDRLGEAWTQAAIQWTRQLGADLGQAYHVLLSGEFILLSSLEPAAGDQLLDFAEGALDRIYRLLQDAAWRTGYGKHVICLFAEEDDYYQYVSDFYNDGVHPSSGGCLLNRGYVHIAMPYLDGGNIRRTLAHELMHNCVAHLPLPLWLNEGLAVVFDRTVAQARQPFLDHELRDRHLAFWSEARMQKFWAGVSFGEPGDSNELSYSLAEIFVNLLLSQSKAFGDFVKHADWHDAGQTAALDALGCDLGETAGTFLGRGNWRPNRKTMLAIREAAKKADQKIV